MLSSTSLFVRLLFVHWDPFHDLADPFAIACIESLGLVSVLKDSWSVGGRPETMTEPLRLSNV